MQESTPPILVRSYKRSAISIFGRRIKYGFTTMALVWSTLVNGYLVLHVANLDSLPLVAPITHIAHFVLLLSLVLLILGILMRVGPKSLVWMGPGAVMFGLWFGPNWLPRSTPQPEGIELRVATFNVYGHNANPYETFDVIEAMDPDIVGLQEIHPFLARKMRRDFADMYPYQATRTLVDFEEFLLLSRFPIVESQFHTEGVPTYLRAVVDVEGQKVVVYVFHPPNPQFQRVIDYDDTDLQVEVEALVEAIKMESDPVLVLCDCNSTPHSRQYAELDSVLDNAFAERGFGFGLTYPAERPLIQIDHIWHSEAFRTLGVDVWDESGTSDHRPVWARLDLRD